VKLDLPVMATLLLGAAVLQEGLPLGPGAIVKVPFLMAVVAYYALRRERLAALTAALWAGVLTDAADGLPLFCTAFFLVAMVFLLRPVRAVLQVGEAGQGLVSVAAAAPLQLLWQAAFGNVLPPEWKMGWLAGGVAWSVPYGAAAALLVFSMAGALDRLAGNVKGVGQADGVSWSQCT
jgi:cell shape-determining protein MreD